MLCSNEEKDREEGQDVAEEGAYHEDSCVRADVAPLAYAQSILTFAAKAVTM
jgi:hypothetical protein